jgi:hypothetical protein
VRKETNNPLAYKPHSTFGVNQSTEMDLHPLSSIRILVVDDFKDWLLQVRLLLQPRPKSHVIDEASDGLEAVQKAEDLNGLNSARHRPPQIKWNRSRPADTTTLPQLQDYLPGSEQ